MVQLGIDHAKADPGGMIGPWWGMASSLPVLQILAPLSVFFSNRFTAMIGYTFLMASSNDFYRSPR